MRSYRISEDRCPIFALNPHLFSYAVCVMILSTLFEHKIVIKFLSRKLNICFSAQKNHLTEIFLVSAVYMIRLNSENEIQIGTSFNINWSAALISSHFEFVRVVDSSRLASCNYYIMHLIILSRQMMSQ